MKVFSLISLFALFGSAFAQPPPLTTLETIWDVQQPTLSVAGDTFTITTVHGVGVSWVSLGTYDVCPNGDANFNGADYQGSPFSYFLTNLAFITDNTFGWTQPSPNYWANAWSFKIDTGLMVLSNLYSESNGEGYVEFCMRYGLVDTEDQATFVLVNFRQMLVQITFDLTNDFEVTGFYTQAIAEQVGTINQEFTVTHGLCDPAKGTEANPYNQGNEICYEVCPDDENARVVVFDNLFLQIVNAPNNAQQLVLQSPGTPVGNIVEAPVYDQPNPNIPGANNCGRVSFLLLGLFFPVDDEQDPAVATVTGDGDVLLTLTRRRLSDGRALEEQSKAHFEPEFKIEQYSDGESGASSILGLAGVAGAMGAALLL